MADPFQDVDAAGADFIKMFADAMDVRQADPTMEKVVAHYLSHIEVYDDALVIEVGSGAGAVARRIAVHCAPASVIGFEPSQGFVDEARIRSSSHENLKFEVADGAQLPLKDGAADVVIFHTVLSHVVDPAILLAEAVRVLKPGGTLIVCDADFSKASFASFENDPLHCCAQAFMRGYVTDPYIIGKLRQLLSQAGLQTMYFDAQSRVVTAFQQMLPWVDVTTKAMVERGEIGEPLADALKAELHRRGELDILYGYQVFATAIAKKAG